MKIVFFGSAEFAVPSLERLLDSGHEILAIVTQPDRKKGRHLKMQATPVKNLASRKGVKIYQPQNVNDPEFTKQIKSIFCDLFVVVSYGQIIPLDILKLPRLYSINAHPSLLPKYRGAAPVNWAIINGEKATGLTIIKMNEKMDAGDIILQRKVVIEREDTSEALNERLSELGAILLLDALRFIELNRITFKRQNDKAATYAPRLKKEDGLIDWSRNALEIHNKVRGTIPWPGSYTYFNNKKINIWKAEVLSGEASPGEIVEAKKELIVGTKKSLLRIVEIQAEGRKRMPAEAFLRGYHRLHKGSKFDVQG